MKKIKNNLGAVGVELLIVPAIIIAAILYLSSTPTVPPHETIKQHF